MSDVGLQSGTLKVLVVGDTRVGKTSIVSSQLLESSTTPTYTPTIAIDFTMRTVTLDDNIFRLQMWDTSGDEKFRSAIRSFCRDNHGVIIVYDVTNRESFNNVLYWVKFIKSLCLEEVPVFLIGNKADLENKRTVKTIEGEEFARSKGLFFFETSFMDRKYIQDVLTIATRTMLASKSDVEDAIKIRSHGRRLAKSSFCQLL